MKKILSVVLLLGALHASATVQSLMYFRGGEDGVMYGQCRAFDSSGYKADTQGQGVKGDGGYSSTNFTFDSNFSQQSYWLDGTAGFYVGSLYGVYPTNNCGVEGWFCTTNLNQVQRQIFSDGNWDTNPASANCVGIGIIAWTNKVFPFVGTNLCTSLGVTIASGTWYHAAVVITNGATAFYTNGVLVGTTNANNAISAPIYYRFLIGINNDLISGFNGWIDEYRLFQFSPGAFSTNDLFYNAAYITKTPVIASLPTWQTVQQERTNIIFTAGENLNLKCTAWGAQPLGYFWYKGSTLVGTGATNTVLNCTAANSGNYSVVVSNAFGMVTSAVASVTVGNFITQSPATGPAGPWVDWTNIQYGMFIHFGPQTFDQLANEPGENYAYAPPSASIYQPLTLNCDQWVRTAWQAGMREVLLTCKHSSGFCLWPTATTGYCVTNAACSNKTDVVKAVSDACHRYNLKFGVYFSFWDATLYNQQNSQGQVYPGDGTPSFYSNITNQLTELLGGNYGTISELFIDGEWQDNRSAYIWHCAEIYDLVKRLQPNCLVLWNDGIAPVYSPLAPYFNTVGTNNDYLYYFPQDLHSFDPLDLIAGQNSFQDPNLPGSSFYAPFQTSKTIQSNGNWFYHDTDATLISSNAIAGFIAQNITNSSVLFINVPPSTNGVITSAYSNQLMQAANLSGMSPVTRPVVWIH